MSAPNSAGASAEGSPEASGEAWPATSAVMSHEGSAELGVGAIADAQRGIVTREQLIACGLRPRTIGRWRAKGRLRVMHRGVYAVGHLALPELARETAAVLACGRGAILSYHSAAAVWSLRPRQEEADVDVTVVGRNCGVKDGICLHRVAELDPRDTRRTAGIPVVAPARSLLEIAASLPARELERALDEGLVRGLFIRADVGATLQRAPHRRGCAHLAELVSSDRNTTVTRSRAEELFRALIGKAGLPQPEMNVRIGRYEVDFLWRSEGLVAEVDGFAFHRDRAAFEADRRRDAELHAAGLTVLRFTWRQIVYEREVVLVRLGQMMAPSLRARVG